MTWYSETGRRPYRQGRLRQPRLCQHLTTLSAGPPSPRSKRPNMRKAAQRMRNRIQNLIQELHHQTFRRPVRPSWLPAFPRTCPGEGGESSEAGASLVPHLCSLVSRGSCCGKRQQTGAKALPHTSKTARSGEIPNLGGAKQITGDGITLGGINGAPEYSDTPALANCVDA